MIRTPPEHNTENPPGQITYRPKQGLYLRDVIARIQGEEGVKLPTPVPTTIVGLEALVGALLKACSAVEENEMLYKGIPSIRTSLIRKIIKENT